ncbi:hypothetical protein KKH15_01440 [Patescibacteria group bacterium]|nr:hypothetical protein [Patescibacteria group bacterium]MBU1754673.1 hypothetical protein [Patescibacteria group bacterium]
METAPVTPPTTSRTTPKDFFLWAGALVALYGATISFITLLFEYINRAYPDPLAYSGDVFGTAVRISMATLIVLTPLAIVLFRLIRSTIEVEPGKAMIWVRRWALVLTLFIAGATVAIDLITLINYFLSGETTIRFLLKVAVVLLVASAVFMHFLADIKGYWVMFPKRANLIGIAVALVAALAIVSGFFIVGTPKDARLIRFDQQKEQDLQSLQYQVLNYWQSKEVLPATLEMTKDPMSGYTPAMKDPQTGETYVYEITGDMSFKLCADFNFETQDMSGKGAYPDRAVSYPSEMNNNWEHGAGETCFERTIDPEIYRPYAKPL